MDEILAVDTSSFPQLFKDGTGNHVAGRKVLQRRRVAFHKALAGTVPENAALAARAFGDQDAQLVDARRVELEKLHVFERDSGLQGHGHAVAGKRHGVARNLEDLAAAAGGEKHRLGVEGVQLTGGQLQRYNSRRAALLDQQVQDVKFVVEVDIILDALLEKGL